MSKISAKKISEDVLEITYPYYLEESLMSFSAFNFTPAKPMTFKVLVDTILQSPFVPFDLHGESERIWRQSLMDAVGRAQDLHYRKVSDEYCNFLLYHLQSGWIQQLFCLHF